VTGSIYHPSLFVLFFYKKVDLLDDLAGPGDAGLAINSLTATIDHYQGGHTSHPVASSRLLANPAQHIQPDNFGSTGQFVFQPIYNGLCHQAGASKIGVELQHYRLTGVERCVEGGQ